MGDLQPARDAELTMMQVLRYSLTMLLALALSAPLRAQDATPALAPIQTPALVAFASEEGLARLARATAKADFPALANQFEAQSNAAFCGPTSAAIVLNALLSGSADLPRDRSRLRSDDLKHLPASADLTLARFTQDNVLDRSPKTRAQVLGEPMAIHGKTMRDVGFQTRQFEALLQAHGVATRLVIVDDTRREDEIRDDLRRNLERRGDYVIVTYTRRAVGQPGGGHISPLGAYDAESDSFLVLDVNPASAGWVWMPTATLVKAMRTFDTVENRGYVVAGPR
jgi:Phytochelatin synthase